MATVLNAFGANNEDENGLGSTGGAGATSVGTSISSAPSVSAATTKTQAPQQAQKPSSSGSFTNLRGYISANKDFNKDQGGLAGGIVKGVTNQANQVQQNTAGAKNAFQQQADTASAGFKNTDLINQALEDPSKFAANKDNLDAFAKARDASYAGPKSLQDLSGSQSLANLQVQAKDVQDKANSGQTENGRFNLLKQMFGTTGYTKGQQTLDNVLLQQDPNQLKKLQGAGQIAAQTNKNIDQTEQAAQKTAADLANQAASVKTDVANRLNTSVGGVGSAVTEQLQKAKEAQNRAADDFASRVERGQVNPDDISRLGSVLGGQEYLYGLTPRNYINKREITASEAATPEQYAKLQALNTLMGGQGNAIGATANGAAQSILNTFSDPTQAGKASQDQFGFSGDFATAVANAAKANKEKTDLAQLGVNQANSFLTGDQYIGGGIENALKSLDASSLALSQLGMQMPRGESYTDATGASRTRAELVAQAAMEKQKLAENQQSLAQLRAMMGPRIALPTTAGIAPTQTSGGR